MNSQRPGGGVVLEVRGEKRTKIPHFALSKYFSMFSICIMGWEGSQVTREINQRESILCNKTNIVVQSYFYYPCFSSFEMVS